MAAVIVVAMWDGRGEAVVVVVKRIMGRTVMGVVIMGCGGVAVIVVTMVAVRRGRCMIVVRGVAVIIMAVRRPGGMVVMPMLGVGRGVSMIVVAVVVVPMVRRDGSMTVVISGGSVMTMVIMAVSDRSGVIVVTVAGVGTVTRAIAVTCAVIVVRLVLVAHMTLSPSRCSRSLRRNRYNVIKLSARLRSPRRRAHRGARH